MAQLIKGVFCQACIWCLGPDERRKELLQVVIWHPYVYVHIYPPTINKYNLKNVFNPPLPGMKAPIPFMILRTEMLAEGVAVSLSSSRLLLCKVPPYNPWWHGCSTKSNFIPPSVTQAPGEGVVPPAADDAVFLKLLLQAGSSRLGDDIQIYSWLENNSAPFLSSLRTMISYVEELKYMLKRELRVGKGLGKGKGLIGRSFKASCLVSQGWEGS